MKKNTCGILSLLLLSVAGLGANCPGSTGSTKATFKNLSFASTIGSTSSKSWAGPTIVDFGATDISSDALRNEQNVDAGAVASGHPFSVVSDGEKRFHVFLNRQNDAATKSTLYSVFNSSITSETWADSLADFTQLDGGTLSYSRKPLTAVDSLGNISLIYISDNGAQDRLYSMMHIKDASAWITYRDITDTGVAFDVEENSVALGIDSVGSTVAVWAQNSQFYFNEYRVSTGWRFTTGVSAFNPVEQAGNTVLQRGVDVGFDGYGNGYGVYTDSSTPNTIIAVRWKGDTAARFSETPIDYRTIDSGASVYGYPKVAVMPDGSAYVFYYYNFDAVDSSELWMNYTSANSTSSPGTFAGSARFDSAVGAAASSVYMVDNTVVLPPVVKVAGSYAVLGFVKSDGSNKRFYVFRYSGGAWSSMGSIDTATSGYDVNWIDLAVNSSGDVAAVYSSTNLVDEKVYGRTYKNGEWSSVAQLNSSTTTNSSSVGLVTTSSLTRPSVAIDSSGNAVATFSSNDSGFGTSARRAVISQYK